jgi:hypothetical protein
MSAKETINPLMSSPQKDSGSLIKELWEHFYPKEFVATLFAYFKDHRKFFDEVFAGHWEHKLKPVPFFFASFSIVLIFSLIFPAANPFVDQAAMTLDCMEVYAYLDENEKSEFSAAFGLEASSQAEDIALPSPAMQTDIQNALNLQGGTIITAEHLQSYLEQKGHKSLALRIENMIFKNKKENEVGELPLTGGLIALLIILWIAGKIIHRFLKAPHRAPRETVYVYLYTASFSILQYIPLGLVGSVNNPSYVMVFLAALSALVVYTFVKQLKVFRYTHNVGFWRLLWAGIKSGLVVVTFGVPLLFMSSEQTGQQKASGHLLQRALLGIAVVVGIFILLYWANTVDDSSDSAESPSLTKAGIQLDEKIASGSVPVSPRKQAESSPTLAEKLLGIWYSEIEETISESEGSLTVRSTTEYFRNSTSTSVGELVLRTYTPEGQEFKIMYNCVATGEWMLHGRKLTEKLIDMKIKPKYFIMNGERTDVDDLEPELQEQFSKIEDEIPKGISEESEILEIGATMMRVKSRDSVGEEKIDVYYKRDKPFVLK